MQQVNPQAALSDAVWYTACKRDDLVAGSGVCALVNGQQVAIFYLPDEQAALYAIDNFDPIGRANVLARGIVGDVRGELVVASPLYKEHFSLVSGRCLEKEYAVRVWPIRRNGDNIEVQYPGALLETA
jgi:nitrite reductase (NADH) small subunit